MLQAFVAKQGEWKVKSYHYLHEQICSFPYRSILIWLKRKGALLFYILVLKIGILHFLL